MKFIISVESREIDGKKYKSPICIKEELKSDDIRLLFDIVELQRKNGDLALNRNYFLTVLTETYTETFLLSTSPKNDVLLHWEGRD